MVLGSNINTIKWQAIRARGAPLQGQGWLAPPSPASRVHHSKQELQGLLQVHGHSRAVVHHLSLLLASGFAAWTHPPAVHVHCCHILFWHMFEAFFCVIVLFFQKLCGHTLFVQSALGSWHLQ